MKFSHPRLHWLLYIMATLLAVGVYFFGLDSQHIPKNGDENPYAHITRLTAASGHLLPLQSEMVDMRNTKPPLLFWQGIASTHQGEAWTLWALRYPSVIYTLLTAALVFLLGWRLSETTAAGFVGALAYLAFFSTYKFGRPFLTNPPEVFWLFLPFFILLYWRTTAFISRSLPVLLGLIIGIGLLYKSFALLMPVGLGLAWWYWREQNYKLLPFLRNDVWKLVVIAVIALAIFSLWFILDPQPQAIWQEFVLKENAGKIGGASEPWLSKFLWGSSSMWVLVLSYPMNAGLLALPVLGLMWNALRQRKTLSDGEKMLWIWLIVMAAVFSIPSQRSARYVLDAMPALAVLCALGWSRLGRIWFWLTLGLSAAVLGFLAWLSFNLHLAQPQLQLYPTWYWLLLGGGLLFMAVVAYVPALTRPGSCIAGLLVFLSMSAFLHPFDGELGQYNPSTLQQVAKRDVWVPIDFNAKYEMYRFILPDAQIQSYPEERHTDLALLAQQYPLFAAHLPLDAKPCAACRVIGERLDLRGRHTSEEISAILHGQVFENLFQKELLIESTGVTNPAK